MATKKDNKNKTKQPKVKQLTLKEFKVWFEGVEELQDDNWTPTSSQWTLIRSRMLNIIEEKEKTQFPIPRPPFQPQQRSEPQPPPGYHLDTDVTISPAAKLVLAGESNGQTASLPPNIDSSDGTFDSPFT